MAAKNNCMNKIIKQCRLCGKYARNLKNLFKATMKVYQDTDVKQFSLKPVPDIIKECLNFSVTENESNKLPKTICTDCMNKLSSWQKFQNLCEKQQHIFSQLNSNSSNQSPTKHCNNSQEILSRNAVHKDVTRRTVADDEIVKNKYIKYSNVKVQNQGIKKVDSDNRIDVPSEEANKRRSRFQRVQKEKQKKTRLMEQRGINSNVNTKQSRARASRCMYCKTIFKTKEEQIFHRGSDTGCAFLCPKCPKEFRLKFSLRKHLETHEERRKYCCHICGNLFMTRACLTCHIQLHDRRNKKFMCPNCPKQFPQSSQLTQHLLSHTGCCYPSSVCVNDFKFLKKWHTEEREHHPETYISIITSEKPYACSECSKRFTQRFQLARHIEGVHKKLKKYKCPTCDKTFLYSHNFKAHLMQHSGQKDVECNICKKCFVTKNALLRHKRFHTGEKPFPCPLCGKLFADCSNRKRHVIQFHGIEYGEDIRKYMEKSGESKPSNRMLDSTQDDNAQHQAEKPNTLRSYFESQNILLSEGKSEDDSEDISGVENDTSNNNSNNYDNDNDCSSSHIQNDILAIVSNENNDKNNINGVLKNLESEELTVTMLGEQNNEIFQFIATEDLLLYENLLINNSTNSVSTDCRNELTNVKNKSVFNVDMNTCKQSRLGKRSHQLSHVFDNNNYTAMFSLSDSETIYVNAVKDITTLVPSDLGLTLDSFLSESDLVETNPLEEDMSTLEINKVVPLDIIKMLNVNGTTLFTIPENEDYIALPEAAANN